jgi:hypothetical protein
VEFSFAHILRLDFCNKLYVKILCWNYILELTVEVSVLSDGTILTKNSYHYGYQCGVLISVTVFMVHLTEHINTLINQHEGIFSCKMTV